jgi:hypothetical protein
MSVGGMTRRRARTCRRRVPRSAGTGAGAHAASVRPRTRIPRAPGGGGDTRVYAGIRALRVTSSRILSFFPGVIVIIVVVIDAVVVVRAAFSSPVFRRRPRRLCVAVHVGSESKL